MTETILVVDDEESVRRTFREWLEGAALGCDILAAADAESALTQANRRRIDLAILDWNLGGGNDGLKLLEDLQVFNPDVVAIMITGFADQATPVLAMRIGVRDYLDKNQDLNRTTFLKAVRNQLDRIRPARRERAIQQGLRDFHDALEKVLPLVRTAATLRDAVPFAEAAAAIVRAAAGPTRARAAYLVVLPDGGEPHVYDGRGVVETAPSAGYTLAGLALSFQGPLLIDDLHAPGVLDSVALLPFERPHRALLAVPLQIGPHLRAVLELFDPDGRFGDEERRLVAALAPLAEDLLRQAVADRQSRRVLLDAVESALRSSRDLASTLETAGPSRPEDPPPPAVLDTIRQGLADATAGPEVVRLAEAIRALAVRYGPEAIDHCLAVVESLRGLLDRTCGTGEPTP